MMTLYWVAVLMCFGICALQLSDGFSSNCTYHPDNTYGGVRANCSALNLSSIPDYLPRNVTTLELDNNNITVLKTGALKELINLCNLGLSNNRMFDVEKDAFLGLSRLEILHLDGNGLLSLEDKDYAVFDHLSHLKVLFINETSVSVSGRQIPKIASLQALYIDCVNCSFNIGFSSLTSLSNLTACNCSMTYLTNSTFVHVPYLEYLSLQRCKIEYIEPGSFESLRQLYSLDISYNWYLGLRELERGFYGLRNSTIKILKIGYLTKLPSYIYPIEYSTFQYLKTSDVKEIYLDGNIVAYISKYAYDSFPDKLELLSLRNTMFGDFSPANLTGFMMLKHLKTLDISGLIEWDPESGNVHSTKLVKTVFIPPKLQIAKLSNHFLRVDVGELQFFPPDVLRTVYVDRNFIRSFNGPVTGIKAVTYFDASNNLVNKLGRNFFPQNNSLKFLNLSNNYLGNCFETDINGYSLKKYHRVEVVDLSNNRIFTLPKLIFIGLKSIRKMILSNNEMLTFHVSLTHMKSLEQLDLSYNNLQTLDFVVQKDLEILHKAVVNLKGNPLTCSCQSFQFLRWISGRQDRIQGLKHMTCTLPSGNLAYLKDLDKTVSELDKQCSSNVVLISVTVSSVMCVLVVVAITLIYRHRWKLRYLYHVGRKGYQMLDGYEEFDYRYDVFVSYADEDRDFVINSMIPELEEKSGLKMCIHHRDFLPGSIITGNIISAIQNSRKTLIVLSPSFLESGWCTYEFNMARVDGISRKQNTIVVVLYEKVLLKDVPKDLAVMLSNNSYLEYNADVYGRVVFWQNLIEAVNTPQLLH